METEARLAAVLSGRYRIVRRLGEGGMGAVYLAEQIAVGNRPVALKVLSRKLLDHPNFIQRFRDEAASTGRIPHPNVVTVYESGQADDGTPYYIAMEFLEGESLRQALSRRGGSKSERRNNNQSDPAAKSLLVTSVVLEIPCSYNWQPSKRCRVTNQSCGFTTPRRLRCSSFIFRLATHAERRRHE